MPALYYVEDIVWLVNLTTLVLTFLMWAAHTVFRSDENRLKYTVLPYGLSQLLILWHTATDGSQGDSRFVNLSQWDAAL
jgi:hypothetical protein